MASLFLFGCSNEAPKKETALTIYTSIYPVQYATEQITGDLATVESLYPPGVDAHTYEPTTRQLTHIARSDLFIYVGAGMESFARSEEHTSELQSRGHLVCRLLLEKKKDNQLGRASKITERSL